TRGGRWASPTTSSRPPGRRSWTRSSTSSAGTTRPVAAYAPRGYRTSAPPPYRRTARRPPPRRKGQMIPAKLIEDTARELTARAAIDIPPDYRDGVRLARGREGDQVAGLRVEQVLGGA